MMKQFWQKWTVDKPAALSDWLWEVFVVQLAARLRPADATRCYCLHPNPDTDVCLLAQNTNSAGTNAGW
jgi:hypothetical protein